MVSKLITALALAASSTPQHVRMQAIATVEVQIISGQTLNLHVAPMSNPIAGAKINTKTALIEFY